MDGAWSLGELCAVGMSGRSRRKQFTELLLFHIFQQLQICSLICSKNFSTGQTELGYSLYFYNYTY